MGIFRFAGLKVIFREAGVGVEGGVEGIVRHVEVEGLFFLGRLGDGFLRFDGEGFGEEGVAAVVVGEVGDAVSVFLVLSFDFVAVVSLAVVAAGLADAVATNVDVEAEIERVLAFVIEGSEVAFSDMDALVAGLPEESGEGEAGFGEAGPVPVGGGELGAVVGFGFDPVCGFVAGGILARHDGDAGGGADGLGVELAEAGALGGEALHVRRAVETVERMLYRGAFFIGEKGERGVHGAHVIDEEEDDVGLVSGGKCGVREAKS